MPSAAIPSRCARKPINSQALRRLGALILFFFAVAAAARAGDPPATDAGPPRLLRAGPLLWHGGPDSVFVWAMPESRDEKLEVALTLAAGGAGEERIVPMPAPADGARATRVEIGGLVPGATYAYSVIAGGRSDETARGTFRLPPRAGEKLKGARFGVVSCMHPRRHPKQVAWAPMLAESPDLLVHLGDSIYANSTDPETIRSWYAAQRRIEGYADLVRLVPTVATWDDHDFGQNDGDGRLAGKERSLSTFREIWPNAGPADGVYRSASYGDVDIFLLDVRYHRSPNDAPTDDKKTILGDAQWEWFEKAIRASKATFKLVASGSTIAAGWKDHWGNYPRDRTRLLGLTKSIPGIVFLTGDIHTSLIARNDAISGVGYPIYEIVSSGVAVNVSTHYFTIIEADTTAADPVLKVRVHEIDRLGKETARHEREIRRSELEPAF